MKTIVFIELETGEVLFNIAIYDFPNTLQTDDKIVLMDGKRSPIYDIFFRYDGMMMVELGSADIFSYPTDAAGLKKNERAFKKYTKVNGMKKGCYKDIGLVDESAVDEDEEPKPEKTLGYKLN